MEDLLDFKLVHYAIIVLLLLVLYNFLKVIFKFIKEQKMMKVLSKSGIKDIDKMDGFQFEVYLMSLFKQLNYKTIATRESHDYGADLVIKKGKEKIVIQAKRYGVKNKVGIDAIQQVYSSIPYYKANSSWVITNSQFTKNAKVLAKACNVNLIDRHKLIGFINKVNPTTTASEIINKVDPETRKCPKCKGALIKRTNKNSIHFMGCENFPRCKHTEAIAID